MMKSKIDATANTVIEEATAIFPSGLSVIEPPILCQCYVIIILWTDLYASVCVPEILVVSIQMLVELGSHCPVSVQVQMAIFSRFSGQT